MTYSEKLRDPRWQKRRLKTFEYANWRCQICGKQRRTLHCHHAYYLKGKEPWDYPKGAIIAVCDYCHASIHGNHVEETKATPTEDATTTEVVPKKTALERFAEMKAMLSLPPEHPNERR